MLYPEAPGGIEDEDLRDALHKVGLDHLRGRLDEIERWDHILSGGEQQRVAFARVLIHKPAWVFMDEATSALDEPGQANIMHLLAEELPKTAVVSIGHRPGPRSLPYPRTRAGAGQGRRRAAEPAARGAACATSTAGWRPPAAPSRARPASGRASARRCRDGKERRQAGRGREGGSCSASSTRRRSTTKSMARGGRSSSCTAGPWITGSSLPTTTGSSPTAAAGGGSIPISRHGTLRRQGWDQDPGRHACHRPRLHRPRRAGGAFRAGRHIPRRLPRARRRRPLPAPRGRPAAAGAVHRGRHRPADVARLSSARARRGASGVARRSGEGGVGRHPRADARLSGGA